MVDTDILLGGFGLFGGRGEYVGKIKLFDIGTEGGDQEGDGDLLAESDEIAYECGARQKYPILFDEAVTLHSGRWYVAWARVSGPSSDCGSSGQAQVTTEDQIQFYFKSFTIGLAHRPQSREDRSHMDPRSNRSHKHQHYRGAGF